MEGKKVFTSNVVRHPLSFGSTNWAPVYLRIVPEGTGWLWGHAQLEAATILTVIYNRMA